ncbi:MAG: DEAD/DEAH box helicase [Acidimicrobiales bacterium]|jgi:superfamily II DNA/RNA helicase|nr:DEAD/DEAH box helicase [Acidimicrobiales bacterium]MDP6281787.1 DEAD/DEAH box helicase [Acidimicrobiales bacterium]MDP7117181.1 DEAD/DEAH box helicase [Acidimicrobiales bacterium]MDP7410778.1 DEAD/DEAH box helicase [Acidimicrobiales bacterium]MEE1521911.1 DEAD/DEAH box helicase [Acidimicrobiales bacterium]|tara:strand:- start:7415 stop:8584 length:1170 start_codon:yes stop_codon:yes gene_type:complete
MTTTQFAELGVDQDLVDVLTERGITAPFEIQTLTIPDGLAGRDVCGRAKTGSGKTLAFGLPLVQLLSKAKPGRPTGLALVPTRELAVQVCRELEPLAKARNISVLAVYGGAPIERQIAALERGVELVVATPGRMIDLIERKDLSVADVQKVVIDEADRMADMGFMPQVEWILRRAESDHQTLLFSATLDGMVGGLISRYQQDPVMHEVAAGEATVEEMEHRFLAVHEMDRVKVAATIINASNRTIVFSRTKWGADKLTRRLVDEGVKAAAIHGDLRQSQREKALGDFGKGKVKALVATDVAARGIHVDDVDVVIHYDPPSDAKTYLHRSGRTARAGESGVVVSLVVWNEELEVRKLLRRLGMKFPIVEVFSNDARLADLHAWDPAEEAA